MPQVTAFVDIDLTRVFGFGVAGNFAGHLEQAGEAADFAGVESAEPEAPKGIFPWFVPGAAGSGHASPIGTDELGPLADGDVKVPAFLGTFPVSSHQIAVPDGDDVNLQIEPEVGLLARVEYEDEAPVGNESLGGGDVLDGREASGGGGPASTDPAASGATAARRAVVRIVPEAIAAFNDCSIRRPGARKISHKKNWGPSSKGLSATLLPIDDLAADGPTATLRLACFLRRDGKTEAYGVDSPLPGYTYYGDRLLDWIVERLGNQTGGDDLPLEPVGRYLRAAGSPERILVGIGATRYTPLGESTYLRVGDDSIVIVYDASITEPDELAACVAAGKEDELRAASVLRQRVVAAG